MMSRDPVQLEVPHLSQPGLLLPAGLVVPMLTPLESSGFVDRTATRYLTDYLVGEGADALFLLGSTGEGDSLTARTQYEFAEAVAEFNRERIPLLLGALQPSPELMIEFLKRCPCLESFTAIVVGVPYYRFLKCKREVISHYQMIYEAIGKPIVVYHLPHAASGVLTPEIVSSLMELEGIVGFKDSSGTRDTIRHLSANRVDSRRYRVYQGEPALSLTSLQDGADGFIAGTANFIPFVFRQLHDAYRSGNVAAAMVCQEEILRFREFARIKTPFCSGGFHFSTFKGGLEVMGFGGATPTPPYQPLANEWLDAMRPYFEDATVLTRAARVVDASDKRGARHAHQKKVSGDGAPSMRGEGVRV